MKLNDVIDEYDKEKISITVREVAGNPDMILLEGEPQSLEFLGKLIIAYARNRDSQGCASHISPNGPGSAYFSKESTKGLFMHVLPCEFEGQGNNHL
jgi:hypothetical protein